MEGKVVQNHGAKRAADQTMAGAPSKKSKGPGKLSIAEKMMAKMGHVKGEGLGRASTGIVEPIQVKLRPQGAGVGAVKEMTAQAKAEARRAAERRGEAYQDSSEEERNAKKVKRKEVKARKAAGLPSAPQPARPKAKIRTAAEIESEDGLVVPDIFKTLVDHTGAVPKQITSGTGIFTQASTSSKNPEVDQVVRHARIELEAFAEAWRQLKDRKSYLDFREGQITLEVHERQVKEAHVLRLEALSDDIASLNIGHGTNGVSVQEVDTSAERLTSMVEQIAGEPNDSEELFSLSEMAVAALFPIFKREMEDWAPLEESAPVIPYLARVKPVLANSSNLANRNASDDPVDSSRQEESLSAYDSMLFTTWFPKVRSAIATKWNPHHPSAILSLLDEWNPVLPSFVYRLVVDQLIAHKLAQSIKSWRPSRSWKHKHLQPHQWIFPWLEFLDDYELDPKSSAGLLAEVKRKYRSAFESSDLADGTVEGLDQWLNVRVLTNDLDKDLQIKLLPRLARHLSDDFRIDPTDQNISAIENVLKWRRYFPLRKFARIFLSSFFPQWHDVLYQWLTADPNYDEVGQWFEWWHGLLPDELNADPDIDKEWTRGLEMMNQAIELGSDRVQSELIAPVPVADAELPPISTPATTASHQATQEGVNGLERDTNMHDTLEELCGQENLLLLPLRKAHPETGLPLLRITASASGTGGAVIYIKGDTVLAQNKRNRTLWQPVDVFSDGALTQLAETF